METISVNYSLKWEHTEHTYYKWSACGKLFNTKTNRQIKKTICGGSIGYWIDGNFTTLTKLRLQLRLIKKEYCPF